MSAYIGLLQERAEKNDIVCATPACEKRVIKEHCIINQWGICAECHDLTCSRCGNLEGDHQIASDLRTCPVSEDDMQVLELADANKWKACPKCGTLIERSEGCNSMACRCGQEFCYTCGDVYEVERSCECPVHFEGGNGEVDVIDLWDPALEQLRSTLQQNLHRLEENVGSGHPLAAAQLHELREAVVGRGLVLAAETRLSVWVGRIMERDHNQWLDTAEERLEIFTVDDLSRLLQW